MWTAATLVVVAVAVLAWRGSDAAATSSTTAEAAVPGAGSPAAQVSQVWDAPLDGPPAAVQSGRVVVPTADGVSVLDPATGDEAWHYTRTGARLCGSTSVDDVVVVLFSTGGRCNELTALRAATGERLWYRSVGFRPDATLSSTDRIVLASSPTGLATVDPVGNNVRWHHAAPAGCRLTSAEAGSTGVAAVQECRDGSSQVVLLDGFDGTQLWSRDLGGDPARVVGADRLVDVVVGDQLEVLSQADGTTLQALALAPGAADGPLLQTGADTTALVWAGGTASALDATTGAVRWSVPGLGLPAPADDKADPGTVVVPEEGAFVTRDLATGAEVSRSTTADDVPAGGRTALVGSTVVVTTTDAVAAYR
ncbi:PQQ-like domain-containing protein [Klenkia soli]|uniref:PQQ-like domain-containing protein n=1 Tax=Klenkia soli TaxID=1052260 RepID=A0A1H0HCV4_9ACTN|nr:PQQ-like domain-containing protein [Klenkia soli]